MQRSCGIKRPRVVSKILFGMHQDEVKKKIWEKSLRMLLKKNCHICANHVKMCDIKSTWNSDKGSSKYIVSILPI